MRQQGVNQFDKGLNLDTNPIAVDNHTLTGALNATMITMNGNELVLQNDMGNGRVDQAQLPKGYVPVGMQEYGGIVYVASYNPLEGRSQLGCFPSPQRNIPSTEIGPQIKLQPLKDFIDSNGEIKELYKRVPLMGNDDIIRTGDKFVITSSSNLSDFEGDKPLIKLKAIVVDSDGSSIDISNDLTKVRENSKVPFVKSSNSGIEDKDYSIYKNRISGKIYLQEELIIPAYVNVKITAKNQNDTITLTIKPTSYDINGEQWSDNVHGYSFKCNHETIYKNGEYIINGLQENDLVHYELYPTYTYGSDVGKVVSLKREDTININDIGSGKVEFSTFRYYNDMVTNSFIFDYGIQAYIEGYEGDNHTLNDVYIEAYEANNVINQEISDSNQIKISLGTLNYFGTYTKMIPYHANTQGNMHYFEAGKHYIGRLHALVDGDTNYTGDWYSVITSTITNKLYLESFDNMIKIQINPEELFTQQVFEFDWETEFSRELIDENTTEEMTSDSDINNILTIPPDSINRRMKYETQKNGFVKYSHSVETKVPKSRTINDLAGGSIKFPYDIIAQPTINYHNDLKASAIINKSGNLADDTIESLTDYTIPNSEVESDTLSNKVWYNESDNELTINYTLYSQFFSKLLKNPANSGNTVNDYKFTIETTMAAFLPYTPVYYSSLGQQQLENILGPLGMIQTNNTSPQLNQQISKIRAEYWFNYCLDTVSWDDRQNGKLSTIKKNSDKYIGIYDGDYGELTGVPYGNPSWIEVFRNMNYSKSALPNWSNISVETSNKLKEKCSMTPFILIWSGTTGEISALNTQEWYNFNNSIKNYSIPMMQDQSGNYYVLNQWSKSSRDLLTEIVNCFNEIYVCQPDQQVTYDYWTGSTDIDDYVYTKNYQLNTSYNVIATINNNNCIPTLNDSVYDTYNRTNNILTLDGKAVKLPIIRLTQTDKSITYTNSFNSPDQSIKNSEFLTTSEAPTLGTCAIILDSTGQHIITRAKKIKSNFTVNTPTSGTFISAEHNTSTNVGLYTITDTAFNPNHVYIRAEGTGTNTYLMDCEDLNNSLAYVSSSKGYLIALAIRNRKLKVVNNPEINSKVIVVNPGVCGRIASSNYKLGKCFQPKYPNTDHNDRTARQPIVKIVRNHILDLKIFKSDSLILSNF